MATGTAEDMHGTLTHENSIVSNVNQNLEPQKEELTVKTEGRSEDVTEQADSDFAGFADQIDVILDRHNNNINDLQILFEEVEYFVTHQIDAVTPKENYGSVQNLAKTVTNYHKQMNVKQPKRAIVFAGEVSSGKSSIINHLLGYNLLPTAHTYSTKLICHLLNSKERKIIPYRKIDNEIKPSDTIYANTNEELKTIVASCHDDPEYEYFEIFLPIEFLRKAPFFIVDTPGIGENDCVDTQLLEYLPEAAGFMFVVNAGNAGGVQKHGLRDIIASLEQNPQDFRTSQKSIFHPKCAAFICNKWDWVPDNEKEDVTSVINRKLRDVWPGYTSDQAINFSVKQPVQNQRQLIQLRLEEMIEKDLESECEAHKRFLHDLFGQIIMNAEKYLQLGELTLDTQTINVERLQQMLKALSNTVEMLNNEFEEHIERKSHEIAVQMHRTLRHRATIWENELLSSSEFNAGKLSQLKQKTLDLFHGKVQNTLSETVQDGEMKTFCNTMRLKREDIEQKLEYIDLLLPAVSKIALKKVFFFLLVVAAAVALYYLIYGTWSLIGKADIGSALVFMGVSVMALLGYKEWNSIKVIEIVGQSREQYVKEWMSELVEKTTAEKLRFRAKKQLYNTAYARLNSNSKLWSSTQFSIKARIATLQGLSKKKIHILNKTFYQKTKDIACNLQKKLTRE